MQGDLLTRTHCLRFGIELEDDREILVTGRGIGSLE